MVIAKAFASPYLIERIEKEGREGLIKRIIHLGSNYYKITEKGREIIIPLLEKKRSVI